jgi:DNA-directed RNA polymerase specialized sigma subunit
VTRVCGDAARVVVSIDQAADADADAEVVVVADRLADPAVRYDEDDATTSLLCAVARLTAAQRFVLVRLYTQDVPLTVIAEELAVSREAVARLRQRALHQLRWSAA